MTLDAWKLQDMVTNPFLCKNMKVNHLVKLTAHSFLAWFVPRLYFNSYKVVKSTRRWRRGGERLPSICWWHSMREDSLTVDSGNSCEGDKLKPLLFFSLGRGNAGWSCHIFWTFHSLNSGGVFVVAVVVVGSITSRCLRNGGNRAYCCCCRMVLIFDR